MINIKKKKIVPKKNKKREKKKKKKKIEKLVLPLNMAAQFDFTRSYVTSYVTSNY